MTDPRTRLEDNLDNYPLFPLGTVLMPGGRMALRIFERRYLDLVRDCMREGSGFGVVWLEEGGSEVAKPGEAPSLAAIGTEAMIVDWDQTDDGLLSIVIEGRRRFSLLASRQLDTGLNVGDIQWRPYADDLPLTDASESLLALLEQLGEHPHVKRLGMSMSASGIGDLVFRLAQLLPLPQKEVYGMLQTEDPRHRLDMLNDLVEILAS